MAAPSGGTAVRIASRSPKVCCLPVVEMRRETMSPIPKIRSVCCLSVVQIKLGKPFSFGERTPVCCLSVVEMRPPQVQKKGVPFMFAVYR